MFVHSEDFDFVDYYQLLVFCLVHDEHVLLALCTDGVSTLTPSRWQGFICKTFENWLSDQK